MRPPVVQWSADGVPVRWAAESCPAACCLSPSTSAGSLRLVHQLHCCICRNAWPGLESSPLWHSDVHADIYEHGNLAFAGMLCLATFPALSFLSRREKFERSLLQLFWIQPNGSETAFAVLKPGEQRSIKTCATTPILPDSHPTHLQGVHRCDAHTSPKAGIRATCGEHAWKCQALCCLTTVTCVPKACSFSRHKYAALCSHHAPRTLT